MNDSDVETLQIDLDRLGEWAVKCTTNINPVKSEARVKDPPNYFSEETKEFRKRAAANI